MHPLPDACRASGKYVRCVVHASPQCSPQTLEKITRVAVSSCRVSVTCLQAPGLAIYRPGYASGAEGNETHRQNRGRGAARGNEGRGVGAQTRAAENSRDTTHGSRRRAGMAASLGVMRGTEGGGGDGFGWPGRQSQDFFRFELFLFLRPNAAAPLLRAVDAGGLPPAGVLNNAGPDAVAHPFPTSRRFTRC